MVKWKYTTHEARPLGVLRGLPPHSVEPSSTLDKRAGRSRLCRQPIRRRGYKESSHLVVLAALPAVVGQSDTARVNPLKFSASRRLSSRCACMPTEALVAR